MGTASKQHSNEPLTVSKQNMDLQAFFPNNSGNKVFHGLRHTAFLHLKYLHICDG